MIKQYFIGLTDYLEFSILSIENINGLIMTKKSLRKTIIFSILIFDFFSIYRTFIF